MPTIENALNLSLKKVLSTIWGIVIFSFAISACTPVKETQLDVIYNESAQFHGPDRNPIIVIPGILGSRIVDTENGRMIWGALDGRFIDPDSPAEIRQLALPLVDSKNNVQQLPLTQKADGILDSLRVNILGFPLEFQVYGKILQTLGVGGYRDENLGLGGDIDYGDGHFTCFQFSYDWRKSNAENAALLKSFIEEKREYVKQEYKNQFGIDDADVKFDIVAHSMGGLLTRYFMRYGDQPLKHGEEKPKLNWAGAELVDRIVLIATPNAGSLNSLLVLKNGKGIGPTLPTYSPEIVATFPSMYELLPRDRHASVVLNGSSGKPVKIFDADNWERFGWGMGSRQAQRNLAALLPHIDDNQERIRIALATQNKHLKDAELFMSLLDEPAKTPDNVSIFLVVGDSEPTLAQVSIGEEGELLQTGFNPGDGTVLRSSVLIDERINAAWQPELRTPIDYDSVLFLQESHLGITFNNSFRDNVLFYLLEDLR